MPAENRRSRPEAVRLVLRHYWQQASRDRWLVMPGMLLPAIGDVFVVYVPPLVVAALLRNFSSGQELTARAALPYVLAFAAVRFGGELLWRLAGYFINKFVAVGMGRLYVDAMDHLLKKDLAFFHDNFAGALTKKALGYARGYDVVMSVISMDVIANVLPLLFVGVVLWQFSPLLIVALVVLVALTLVFIFPLIRRRQALVDAREASSNALAGHVADSITNMEAVRAFARERHEATVHRANVDDFVGKARRSWDYQNIRINMVTGPMYVLTNTVGLVIALTVGDSAGISLEAVFVSFSYYTSFTRVLWEFNHIYRNLESYLSEAAQFTDLLLEPPSVVDPEQPAVFTPRDATVEFRDVTFRYHDRSGEHLFTDLSFTVRSGERVGLVGHSGGGKTTITRLLLRFMDVDGGSILIGGQDISAIRQEELRSMIAYVPQDPVMFHRSLLDNIRFGRLDATDDEVREAARLAHAAEFIEALPAGYDTLVGERGIKLSGGQRQRVAIARAILRDAPILVLDEATSSLDSESERLIQDALWTLMHGRTAIVIAHRLSTVQRMDRLIVLERGTLIEQGSHRELLERGGIYATLWAQQSGGFLDDDEDEHEERDAPAIVT